MVTPTDMKLYDSVKKNIYTKYPKHSAYRSGLLVKKYKEIFKTKYGSGKSPYKGNKPKLTGLTRWFKEEWKSDTGKTGYTSKSSVYRPTKRITSQTPKTFDELSTRDIQRAKSKKRTKGRVDKF
jgi:hypothetical protein